MGADVPDAEIEAILGSLGFAPERADGLVNPAGGISLDGGVGDAGVRPGVGM